jgi:hypothetical protein
VPVHRNPVEPSPISIEIGVAEVFRSKSASAVVAVPILVVSLERIKGAHATGEGQRVVVIEDPNDRKQTG